MSTAAKATPLHPGTVLAEDFLRPMRIEPSRLARDIGVAPMHITQIIQGKRPITADLALRLGRYLATPAGFWMTLQSRYDLAVAWEHEEDLESIHPLEAVSD
jgi:addiction module HigA family antidote